MNKTGLALLAFVLGLSACSGSGNEVAMVQGQVFEPETITISAGDTVVWTNEAADPHTVTAVEDDLPADAEYFSSGDFSTEELASEPASLSAALIVSDETYSHEFTVPGTYRYYCIPHRDSGMTGTVIVEP